MSTSSEGGAPVPPSGIARCSGWSAYTKDDLYERLLDPDDEIHEALGTWTVELPGGMIVTGSNDDRIRWPR